MLFAIIIWEKNRRGPHFPIHTAKADIPMDLSSPSKVSISHLVLLANKQASQVKIYINNTHTNKPKSQTLPIGEQTTTLHNLQPIDKYHF